MPNDRLVVRQWRSWLLNEKEKKKVDTGSDEWIERADKDKRDDDRRNHRQYKTKPIDDSSSDGVEEIKMNLRDNVEKYVSKNGYK